MPDRSRFFVVPFDPDKPIEEVSNAGVAQKRLAEKDKPPAVGVEYLVTGYKEQMRQEPQAQAVQALMRRVLKGTPSMILTTREIAAQKAEALGQEPPDKVPGPQDPPRPPSRMDVG